MGVRLSRVTAGYPLRKARKHVVISDGIGYRLEKHVWCLKGCMVDSLKMQGISE